MNRNHTDKIVAFDKWLPSVREAVQITVTFVLVTIGWIFFRAETIYTAFHYIVLMFTDIFSMPAHLEGIRLILLFLVMDWFARKDERCPHPIVPNMVYITFLTVILLVFGKGENENIEFIYFQF
jgi:hypothetical protein